MDRETANKWAEDLKNEIKEKYLRRIRESVFGEGVQGVRGEG